LPIIEVKLYDRRVTPEATPRIIERLTQALADACEDEGIKQHTHVLVTGVAPSTWGIAGQPQS
jgi:phenylpyruvate tautomerase PptA (4-oxalocrotonate tautomerase family)